MAEAFSIEFNGFGWQTVYPEKWAENSCTFGTVELALVDMIGVVCEIGDETNTPQHPDNVGASRSFYAVSGRMHGDDEATTLVFVAEHRSDAEEQYIEEMWDLDGCSAEDRLRLEENGEGVLIDSVVQSDTVIREV